MAEIARAYLQAEPTVAARIGRAKKTIGPRRRPVRGAHRRRPRSPARFGARGHLPDLQRGLLGHRRRGLAAARAVREAVRLARVLAAWPRIEAEVQGLLALMEIQSSRASAPRRAGRGAGPAAGPGPAPVGSAVDQPRAGRARPLSTSWLRNRGPYALQAAHRGLPRPSLPRRGDRLGSAGRPLRPSWPARTPSPIVELNRAVAVSMLQRAGGPAAGLDLIERPGRDRCRWTATTCCTACAATCSTVSGATRRRRTRSTAPPRSTRRDVLCRAALPRAAEAAGAAANRAQATPMRRSPGRAGTSAAVQ